MSLCHTSWSWLVLPFKPVQSSKEAQAHPSSCVGPKPWRHPGSLSLLTPSAHPAASPLAHPQNTPRLGLSFITSATSHPYSCGHLSAISPLCLSCLPNPSAQDSLDDLTNCHLPYPPPTPASTLSGQMQPGVNALVTQLVAAVAHLGMA